MPHPGEPPTGAWALICSEAEAPSRGPWPLALLGLPLVWWQPQGGAPTLTWDRCPHRRVPLSQGWVAGDRLVCAYHGWAFGPDGACRERPAELSEQGLPPPLPGWSPRRWGGAWWLPLGDDAPPEEGPAFRWRIQRLGAAAEAVQALLTEARPSWSWRAGPQAWGEEGLLCLVPVAPWACLVGWGLQAGAWGEASLALQARLGALVASGPWPPPPPGGAPWPGGWRGPWPAWGPGGMP